MKDRAGCKKSRPVPWRAPEPIQDPVSGRNPWPDTDRVPLMSTNKVEFVDEGHLYFLQDKEWAYPSNIMSGSQVTKYWETFVKIQACGDMHDTDPVVQVKTEMDRDKNLRNSNISPRNQDDQGEDTPRIRSMLTEYLNQFLSWGVRTPDFATRSSRLVACLPPNTTKTFPHHVQHRMLRNIEEWLLAEDKPKMLSNPAWADMLRYIRCPSAGFGNVLAVDATNQHLSEFLTAEWERMNSEKPLLPMCAKEVSRATLAVTSKAGSIAHEYIERTFDPERGPLPELHEAEDMVCVQALLDYLKEKNVTFRPENIERRVGSLLYKFCGSMDGLRQRDEDGVYEVWDWKRSSQVAKWLKSCTRPNPEDPHYLLADPSKVAFSTSLMDYFIQAASYRQLELLDHPEKNISTSAFLGVFHPSLESKFVIVEMPLDGKMHKGALVTSKGVANYETPEGELLVCTEGMTSIEYVKCFMHHRLTHLKRHFKCNPDT